MAGLSSRLARALSCNKPVPGCAPWALGLSTIGAVPEVTRDSSGVVPSGLTPHIQHQHCTQTEELDLLLSLM